MSGMQWHRIPDCNAAGAARPQNLSGPVRELRWEGTNSRGRRLRRASIERNADPLLFAPDYPAEALQLLGLNRESEAVWNIKRAHNFKGRACRRQVFYGAADGTAAAEFNRASFQYSLARRYTVFAHGLRQ